MRRAIAILAVLCAAPAAAQIQSRPTDAPIVTADNDAWYLRGEPVQFAGDVYYPGGATVFFNGNTMVRSGNYNGVPLYTDATVEPFSIVYVPLSRGLMKPYERRRAGALAGTTGSRAPSFPVQVPTTTAAPISTSAPAIAAPAASIATTVPNVSSAIPGAVGTGGYVVAPRPQPAQPLVTARRPQNNDGVWVEFAGERWISSGAAVPFSSSAFIRVGDHAGFPVYARRELKEEIIYLPTRPGVVAPYRLKN